MACLAIPNPSLVVTPGNPPLALPLSLPSFTEGTKKMISSSFFGSGCRNHLGRKLDLVPGRLWKTKSTERKVVYASLFGVGAPEALVIGVVALIVFGPKGLAEVARTLGKSLRAFQPTIQELQQVSKEFKKTLEEEIGLNELTSYDSNTSYGNSMQAQQGQPSTISRSEPVESTTQPTTNLVKVTEEQAKALVPEEQRKAAEAAAWGGAPPTKVEELEHGSGLEVVVKNVEASEV